MGRYYWDHATEPLSAPDSSPIYDADEKGYAADDITVQPVFEGGPETVVWRLLGSLDGVNFTDLSGDVTGSDMVHIANKPAKFYRWQLVTLSGGTSPTVKWLNRFLS